MPLAADDFADRRSFRGGDAAVVGWLFGIARHQLAGYYPSGRDAPRARQLCGERALFYGARRVARRTVLWGAAGRDSVRELVVSGPDGLRRSVRPEGNRAFVVVLDPKVDPADLRVEVRYEDGRVRRTGPDHGLVR